MIQGILGAVAIPSAFMLQVNDGRQLAGTLKEAGMEEPISTYHFKHGVSGLADVHLIGIKWEEGVVQVAEAAGLLPRPTLSPLATVGGSR